MFEVITVIYTVLALVPISIWFLTRKHQHPSMIYLLIMLIASFLVDGFGVASHHWFPLGKKLNIVSNTYGFLEIVTIIMMYQMHLAPAKKLPFILIAVLLVGGQLAEMFVFRSFDEFPGTSRSIFAIVVTVFALLYFFRMMRDVPNLHFYRVSMFRINIGMLVYFAGNFSLFTMTNYLVHVLKDNLVFHWSLHNLLGILTYILFSIGLWQARREAM